MTCALYSEMSIALRDGFCRILICIRIFVAKEVLCVFKDLAKVWKDFLDLVISWWKKLDNVIFILLCASLVGLYYMVYPNFKFPSRKNVRCNVCETSMLEGYYKNQALVLSEESMNNLQFSSFKSIFFFGTCKQYR